MTINEEYEIKIKKAVKEGNLRLAFYLYNEWLDKVNQLKKERKKK